MIERFYKSLTWLACVAIVVGLIAAILYSQALQRPNIFPNGYSFSGGDSAIITFFNVLASQWFVVILGLSNVIVYGTIVLGIVTAWVTRRRGWLIALTVMILLVQLWPAVTQTWTVIAFMSRYTDGARPLPALPVNAVNFSIYAAPLIPVVMSLVFALTRHRSAPQTETDAELGIVRSAL